MKILTATLVNNNIENEINYFDVELADDAIDNISISLGPLSTNADALIVESLLDKYTRNGKYEPSILSGAIR